MRRVVAADDTSDEAVIHLISDAEATADACFLQPHAPKSQEILMFVCMQKDHKKCCDTANRTGRAVPCGKLYLVSEHCSVFLETNKHQNLMRLRLPVAYAAMML